MRRYATDMTDWRDMWGLMVARIRVGPEELREGCYQEASSPMEGFRHRFCKQDEDFLEDS